MASAQPSTLQLRARLLALVAALVVFDVLFVAAMYVLAHVAVGLAPLVGYQWEGLFWSLSFDIVPLWPVLAVGTPLVLAVQFAFGYRTTLRGTEWGLGHTVDGVPGDGDLEIDGYEFEYQPVADRVTRLAQVADVTPPELQVIDSSTPNSFVASRPGERTLFVTTGLLDRLDGDELDAVLAHELAHLENGDAFVMTAAAFLPAVTARFNELVVRGLRKGWITGWLFADGAGGNGDVDEGEDEDEDDSGGGAPQFEIALLVFALVAVPTVSLLHTASTACYRLLSRIREYAADAGGVAIAGSPAAMADALETLTDDDRPEQDLRTATTGVRELCVLPYAIEDGESEDGAGDSSATDDGPGGRLDRLGHYRDRLHERVLPGSHPSVESRIAALRERQTDLERGESVIND